MHSFYTLPGALQLRDALQDFHQGHLIVNIAEMPIKCLVAPIEFVFLADYFFHLRGERDKVRISLLTPNPGAFSKPNTNRVLTKIAADKHIDIVPNFEIERVDAANTTIHAFNGDSLSYDLLTIVAPIRGPTVLPEACLANDMNYGLTDHRTLKSKVADNIYFIGDNTVQHRSQARSHISKPRRSSTISCERSTARSQNRLSTGTRTASSNPCLLYTSDAADDRT